MTIRLSPCSTCFLAAVLALPAFASAQDAAPAAPATPAIPAAPGPGAPDAAAVPSDALPGHFAEERHSSTAEVVAIDPATRIIMLKEEGDDQPQAYSVGKDVRNLDQVRAGDRVKVDSYTSTSIKVLGPGELVNEDVSNVQRSQPGEKPGGIAMRKKTITANVSSIFPDSKEFLTRNASGQLRRWKVRDAKDLENLHSDDRVQLTIMSSLAVSVTPAPAATTGATVAAPAAGGTAAPAAATTPPASTDAPAATPPATPAETPATPATPAK